MISDIMLYRVTWRNSFLLRLWPGQRIFFRDNANGLDAQRHILTAKLCCERAPSQLDLRPY